MKKLKAHKSNRQQKIRSIKAVVRNHLPALILAPFFIFLFKISRQRVSSFGCFDECFNYGAGYFMLKGKVLYSEVFFNHQPLLAYLSYLVQLISHPRSVYELLLAHHRAFFAFSLVMDVLIYLRFRFVGLGFILFFEPTKYYLFGERFLAESFIIYPLVYLFGLSWHKIENRKFFSLDYILAGIFLWFIIFSREPYLSLAIFLYLIFLWGRSFSRIKILSLGSFLLLSAATIFSLPKPDYFFNVFWVNLDSVTSEEVKINLFSNLGIIKGFIYPLFIFFYGKWNNFRFLLIFLDLVFLSLLWLKVFRQKKLKEGTVLFFVLGLANLRVVPPGSIFYGAFHMLEWYGLFLFAIFLFLESLRPLRRIFYFLTALLFFGLGLFMVWPGSYLWDKVDRQAEFLINYDEVLSRGEVIKILADPKDTLFLENRQDLIYWEANLPSAYKYSWYNYMMPDFSLYLKARSEMFQNYPPDFYYGSCSEGIALTLPKERVSDYTQLYFNNKPTCLFVKKEKIRKIPKERFRKLNNEVSYDSLN